MDNNCSNNNNPDNASVFIEKSNANSVEENVAAINAFYAPLLEKKLSYDEERKLRMEKNEKVLKAMGLDRESINKLKGSNNTRSAKSSTRKNNKKSSTFQPASKLVIPQKQHSLRSRAAIKTNDESSCDHLRRKGKRVEVLFALEGQEFYFCGEILRDEDSDGDCFAKFDNDDREWVMQEDEVRACHHGFNPYPIPKRVSEEIQNKTAVNSQEPALATLTNAFFNTGHQNYSCAPDTVILALYGLVIRTDPEHVMEPVPDGPDDAYLHFRRIMRVMIGNDETKERVRDEWRMAFAKQFIAEFKHNGMKAMGLSSSTTHYLDPLDSSSASYKRGGAFCVSYVYPCCGHTDEIETKLASFNLPTDHCSTVRELVSFLNDDNGLKQVNRQCPRCLANVCRLLRFCFVPFSASTV
jgi:hypothetical protein